MIESKLARAGIQLIPADIPKHYICERDGFIALVDRATEHPGAAGLLTEKGLAPLVWRDGEPWFVARGLEQRATDDQVEQLRRFQSDLDNALRRPD